MGIASSPDGGGYWVATSAGELRAFGDAKDLGSPASYNGFKPAASVIALTAVPTPPLCGPPSSPPGSQPSPPPPPPQGYWMTGSDGGVFTYGDAQFHGSAAKMHLAAPIVASAGVPPDPSACPV